MGLLQVIQRANALLVTVAPTAVPAMSTKSIAEIYCCDWIMLIFSEAHASGCSDSYAEPAVGLILALARTRRLVESLQEPPGTGSMEQGPLDAVSR